MSDNDVNLAVALEQIKNLIKADERHSKEIEQMQSERNKALVWGIVALLGTLSTVVMWTANFLKDHLK